MLDESQVGFDHRALVLYPEALGVLVLVDVAGLEVLDLLLQHLALIFVGGVGQALCEVVNDVGHEGGEVAVDQLDLPVLPVVGGFLGDVLEFWQQPYIISK